MIRAATVVAGLGLAAYGGWRLWDLGVANLRHTLTWLVGGVVLHDAVLAPLTVALVLVAVRLVPRAHLTPWAVWLVVVGPVTLLSVPVLGRFGARPSEPSLLDRHYWPGWWALVAVVTAAILVGTYAGRRRRPTGGGGEHGPGDGGR